MQYHLYTCTQVLKYTVELSTIKRESNTCAFNVATTDFMGDISDKVRGQLYLGIDFYRQSVNTPVKPEIFSGISVCSTIIHTNQPFSYAQ